MESGQFDTVVLCLPRAQGKSTLAAALCVRALTPGDRLYHAGTESHLIAATIAAARRTCFKILRRLIEESAQAGDYQISESPNGCHVRHKASNTRVSVVAATSKAVLGLVGCPLVIVDEPGSYELEGGKAVWDALATAIGKPESALRLFLIGHLAPRAAGAGHLYFDLVHRGTRGRTWSTSSRRTGRSGTGRARSGACRRSRGGIRHRGPSCWRSATMRGPTRRRGRRS